MVLHTLNAGPRSSAFTDCLALAGSGDTILLLGDGVYSAIPGGAARELLDTCPARVLVLDEDARAAGVLDKLDAGELLDMGGFVALSEQHPRQLAWY